MVRRLGKRAVLRTGYAAIILVLILSAMEAYWIQAASSEQQIEIFRHFVEEEEVLTNLRRNLWQAGNYVRDFFIQTTPEQARLLGQQLSILKEESAHVLNHLATISPQNPEVPRLRKSLDEYWAVVEPVGVSMLDSNNAAQLGFIQREVVPRRGQLSNALTELSVADQQRLQENEKQFADARHEAVLRLLIMLGLGVILSLLVAVVSIRHSENLEQQAEEHYAEVEHARGELKQLSARLLEIEEEGRRSLARELHDEVGQSLALLQIEISHAQTVAPGEHPVLLERLQRARALTESTVQNIRDLSILLRPALLDDLGLVPALQFQIDHFQRRSGKACEFTEENVAEQLPDGIKTCVYRVVQEALHNCEKHSYATKVEVSVRQSADALVVEVKDNGQGFQIGEKGRPSKDTGMGMLGMRERASIAGGSLLVDSSPGRGTLVALRVPVRHSVPEPAPTPSDKVTA